MIPQRNMRSESHIDGRSRFRKTLDGTCEHGTSGNVRRRNAPNDIGGQAHGPRKSRTRRKIL